MGIHGNEAADYLAKEALKIDSVQVNTPLPERINKNKIDVFMRKKWDDYWSEYKEARQTKLFYSTQSKSKAHTLIKYSRGKISKFINATTGHNNLAYHTSLQFPDYSDGCNFCNTEKETFYHWATDCPAFWLSRRNIFLDKTPDSGLVWEVDKVIEFADITVIHNLLEAEVGVFNDDWNSTDSEN